MKISEFIKKLNYLMFEYGDLDIKIENVDEEGVFDADVIIPNENGIKFFLVTQKGILDDIKRIENPEPLNRHTLKRIEGRGNRYFALLPNGSKGVCWIDYGSERIYSYKTNDDIQSDSLTDEQINKLNIYLWNTLTDFRPIE